MRRRQQKNKRDGQMLMFAVKQFYLDGDAKVGSAKDVQWWKLGCSQLVKAVNRSTQTRTLRARVQVATTIATICDDDVESVVLLKESVPEEGLESPQSLEQGENDPAWERGPRSESESGQHGALGSGSRAELLRVPEKFKSKGLLHSTPTLFPW